MLDTVSVYDEIEIFGLTEKDATLAIPTDDVLRDTIMGEAFDALFGPMICTGLEAEIEPLAHGLATVMQRRKVALQTEIDRTADKIQALAKSHDGSEIAETELETAQEHFLKLRDVLAAIETMAEKAAECYEQQTGHAFIPASGSRASARAKQTGAVFEAKQLLEAHDRETAEANKIEGVPLIVSGATDWTDVDTVFHYLDRVRARIQQNRGTDVFLCHKGGKGAEKIAAGWARARGLHQARFDPRWKAHGKAAPFKANDEMLDDKFAAVGVVLFGGNGVALNLGQKAEDKGITVMRIAAKAENAGAAK